MGKGSFLVSFRIRCLIYSCTRRGLSGGSRTSLNGLQPPSCNSYDKVNKLGSVYPRLYSRSITGYCIPVMQSGAPSCTQPYHSFIRTHDLNESHFSHKFKNSRYTSALKQKTTVVDVKAFNDLCNCFVQVLFLYCLERKITPPNYFRNPRTRQNFKYCGMAAE